jgi:hypothetical protein
MSRPHVGTLGEKALHAALKRWYAEPGDLVEEPVDGYVIDLVRDGLLIEVQTGGFSSLRRKLADLLERHAVRLVHPIPVTKWIVKLGDDAGALSRRRSPKRRDVLDVFDGLVSIPGALGEPGFTLDVVLVEEEEVRRFDGRRGRRRNGWVVDERRLVDVLGTRRFETAADLATLLPDDLPTSFTTQHLAAALGRRRRLAQQMTYCLRHLELIEMVGKEGNTIVYRRV